MKKKTLKKSKAKTHEKFDVKTQKKECFSCLQGKLPQQTRLLKDRLLMEPCPIGIQGKCCKHCLMGPCRVLSDKVLGVCGANEELIVARNILRFTAGGTAAHCGHAYHLLNYLNKNYPNDYIKKKAPSYLYNVWDKMGILPKIRMEHFKEISEALHLSTMGVDADYKDVLAWCFKLGIIDGYYGLYLATELEDRTFGKPKIKEAELNLNVIKPDKINIAVHGHEPSFAEALAEEAKQPRNSDINLVGVCCTGSALLARHGIPMAANFVLQEDVIATGVIEAMVVDVQCIMPSLENLCECYHTKLITTNDLCKIPGAIHIPIKNKKDAQEAAKRIIELARLNRTARKETNFNSSKNLPKKVVVGFTEDNFPIKPGEIAQQIQSGALKGIIAVVGCVNPRVKEKDQWISVFKELGKDYLILTTGCVAFEFGKQGLLDGKKIFHLGSCVNNSRIAELFKKIAEASSKLNKKETQITDLPFLVSCPMPITEKALAIGMFFASLGVDIHFGYPFLVSSDSTITNFLANILQDDFKSRVMLETNPQVFLEMLKKDII
jgi:carbon-monoxide dehydrogenase catalytic subunit